MDGVLNLFICSNDWIEWVIEGRWEEEIEEREEMRLL